MITASILISKPAYAAPRDLDSSFGTNGKLVTDFFGGADRAEAVAIQPDDKIVAAGYVSRLTVQDFAVARCNVDGSLDARFGVGGKATVDFNGTLGPFGDEVVKLTEQILQACQRPRDNTASPV